MPLAGFPPSVRLKEHQTKHTSLIPTERLQYKKSLGRIFGAATPSGALVEKKWSYVLADQAEFAKKIEDVKNSAISDDLVGLKIVEKNDGVIVAVYELPAGTHVAFVIRSKSQSSFGLTDYQFC